MRGALLLCFALVLVGASSQEGVNDDAFKRLVSQYRAHVKSTSNLSWGTSRGRVAVGFNANLDLIARAKPLFDRLGHARFHKTRAVDHVTLGSLEDFVEAFLLYSQLGKAAERFVTNATFFSFLVEECAALEGSRYAVGGNAALMAKNIAEDFGHAVDVLLGGVAREKLRPLLVQEGKAGDVLDVIGPLDVMEDQVHLILEYAAGDVMLKGLEWKAGRSNRFIASADVANAELKAAEPFFKRLHTWPADAVIVSGLHLLDGIAERPRRRDLLRHVRQWMQEAKKKLSPEMQKRQVVHFEWASIGDASLVADIASFILTSDTGINSVGCNEEELRSIYVALNGTSLTKDHFAHRPLVAHMEHALHHVLSHLPRSIQRIHFHSLGLHIVAIRSEDSSRWLQQDIAVAAGAIQTSLRVCGEEAKKKFFQSDDDLSEWFEASSTKKFSANDSTDLSPGSSWTTPDKSITFFAAPVLVCRRPLHTVGAGDSISSTALMMSLRPMLEVAKKNREEL